MGKLTFRGIIAKAFLRICGMLPLQDKAVFSSFDGKAVSDNPREIYLEMKRVKPDIKYVWVLQNRDSSVNGDIVVKPFSFPYLYHLATSKLWVDNSRKKKWTVKRKGQYYVQTWHGDVCLKKIEKDAAEDLSEVYIENAKYDAAITDLMISGSDFGTQLFRNALWYTGKIIETGAPKSAVYYSDPAPFRKKVKNFLSLDDETRMALYCPTFRTGDSISAYNLDYKKTLEYLEKYWGGRWGLLVRLHPKLMDQMNCIQYTDQVLNATSYPATSDLVMASDLIITDYSSCMFDGLEANKKVLLYASDLEAYLANERGMYFDIRELPFPFADGMDQLEKNIQSFNDVDYFKQTERFKEKIGYKTNSSSVKTAVEYIIDAVWE